MSQEATVAETLDPPTRAALVAELVELRRRLDEIGAMLGIAEQPAADVADPGAPIWDPDAREVEYQGRRLHLGDDLPGRAFQWLLQHAGTRRHRSAFICEVWRDSVAGQPVTDEGAAHQVIRRLRERLRAGGMPDLAAAIVWPPRSRIDGLGLIGLDPIWRRAKPARPCR